MTIKMLLQTCSMRAESGTGKQMWCFLCIGSLDGFELEALHQYASYRFFAAEHESTHILHHQQGLCRLPQQMERIDIKGRREEPEVPGMGPWREEHTRSSPPACKPYHEEPEDFNKQRRPS